MRQILVFFCAFSSLFLFPALTQSQGTLPTGDFLELRSSGTAEVIQIIDPQTLQLHDGRIIRLAGLSFPDLQVHEAGELSVIAIDILRDMLEGQAVTIYQTKKNNWGQLNRMGHHLAHLERISDKAWVQGTLISLGLARVMTGQRNPEMAAQMYALEKNARQQNLGLWAESSYQVLNPEQAADHIDSFQIVKGEILSAALKKNRIYLNFGKDWRTDFTVSIAPTDKRLFLKQGLNPLQWNGQAVRVRGWIRSYNGPYMEISHPQAIEILGNAIDSNH